MTRPIPKARTLVTDDGVAIDAVHLVGDDDVAIVLAHGFTLNWQHGAVWKAATRLNRGCGVITFDFRGHGRSGGVSTLGHRAVRDVDVLLRYARGLGYHRVAHARQLYEAAHDPKELWIVPGFGHAESGATEIPGLLDRIGGWVREAMPVAATPNAVA